MSGSYNNAKLNNHVKNKTMFYEFRAAGKNVEQNSLQT